MVKDGKTWHWCNHHKMWNFHTTSECKARIKAAGNNTPPATGAEAPVSYAATFAATMAAINEETDSSEPVEWGSWDWFPAYLLPFRHSKDHDPHLQNSTFFSRCFTLFQAFIALLARFIIDQNIIFLCLPVLLMLVIIISASLHDTHPKTCKMWPTVESVGIFKLTQCPCPYVHVRVHKERRYLFQKFKGKNNRTLYGIRNNTCPSFFISHPSPVLPIPDKTHKLIFHHPNFLHHPNHLQTLGTVSTLTLLKLEWIITPPSQYPIMHIILLDNYDHTRLSYWELEVSVPFTVTVRYVGPLTMMMGTLTQ